MTLLEKAQKAIQELFSDAEVPAETTRDQLEELRDEIESMLESLSEGLL